MKLVCDGSISERTARLREPYVGRPNDRGILVTPEAELYEKLRAGHAADWQIGTHATATRPSTSRCGSTSGCSASSRAAIRAFAWSTAR